jgi:radical SAM-linked protein
VPLPWEEIEIGIDRAWLEREWRLAERAAAGETTPDHRDCSLGVCTACGLPCAGTVPVVAVAAAAPTSIPALHDAAATSASIAVLDSTAPSPFHRTPFIFARHASAAMIGHLEMMKQFERAFRRAEVKVAISAGFNPRPRLRFALSMPLGVEADFEYAEVDLVDPVPPDFIQRINTALPQGFHILKTLTPLSGGLPTMTSILYRIISMKGSMLSTRLNEMLSQELSFERKGKVRKVLVSEFIEDISIISDEIHLRLKLAEGPGLPISEIINPLREIDPDLRVIRSSFDYL